MTIGRPNMKTTTATRSRRGKRRRKWAPSFASGVVVEPHIAFGGRHEHVDPKTGLALYGPYTPAEQMEPPLRSIVVGLVGPPEMIPDAEQWLDVCRGQVCNDGSQPFLYPHFPGCAQEPPFGCELISGSTWREAFRPADLAKAISEVRFEDRVTAVADLYIQALQTLSQREPRPDVVVCCVPEEVIDYCTTRPAGDRSQRRRLTKAEREALEAAASGQGFLFSEMDPSLALEGSGTRHENLRRAIKAKAMQFGLPTQLVWPHTLRLTNVQRPGERRAQDPATRAWNFVTALYHKAGGSPWRLAETDPGVCYVGISFYRELADLNPRLRTSMAQVFTSAGDGFVIRGDAFDWTGRGQASPHLRTSDAAALMSAVLEMYQRQSRGSLPNRLVIHKSSRFWEEELRGFRQGASTVPQIDLVALGRRRIQFYRSGEYPPIRGTYVKFSDTNLLLYTTGFVPYLRTYPGPRVPQPLEVLEHHGDSPWDLVLRDILALTKLNWNSADFACSEPISIAFARRVGAILAELPAHMPMRPEYRYYM